MKSTCLEFFNVLPLFRSDNAELVQPFLNDLFQRTVTPVLVYK